MTEVQHHAIPSSPRCELIFQDLRPSLGIYFDVADGSVTRPAKTIVPVDLSRIRKAKGRDPRSRATYEVADHNEMTLICDSLSWWQWAS